MPLTWAGNISYVQQHNLKYTASCRTGEVRGAGKGGTDGNPISGGLQSGCKAPAERVRFSSAEWIRPNLWEQWDADEQCFKDSAMIHKALYR